MRLSRVLFVLVFAASSLTFAQSASACAPAYACAGPWCWYYLLNDDSFNGSTCTPGWVGTNVINSNLCTDSIYGTPYKVDLLDTSNSVITQSFSVPNGPGSISVGLMYATSGTPTSSDHIVLELWEAGVLKESITINPSSNPTYCHREDYSFTGSYAGKTIDLRVKAQIATSGLSFHLDWITLFYM
jgi:hypothetical protein